MENTAFETLAWDQEENAELQYCRARGRALQVGSSYAIAAKARFSPHPSALFRLWDGLDWTERAGTRSDGRKQCRHSADGCGEDRASAEAAPRRRTFPDNSGQGGAEQSSPPLANPPHRAGDPPATPADTKDTDSRRSTRR